MKAKCLLLTCFAAVALVTPAFALTTEHEITLGYVREHPNEFAVNVTKGKAGLIDFTITHNVAMRMYHVARLAIYHRGTLIATSDTPSFGKKGKNTFYFSLAAEDIAESRFSLSDGGLAGSGADAVPIPGTIIHRFRLSDFLPKQFMNK